MLKRSFRFWCVAIAVGLMDVIVISRISIIFLNGKNNLADELNMQNILCVQKRT